MSFKKLEKYFIENKIKSKNLVLYFFLYSNGGR